MRRRVIPRALYPLLCVIFVGAVAATMAHAHNISRSSSSWRVSGDKASILFAIAPQEIPALFPNEGENLEARLTESLSNMFRLSLEGEVCPLSQSPKRLDASERLIRFSLEFQCPREIGAEAELILTGDIFFSVLPTHIHYIRVSHEGIPDFQKEALLSNGAPLLRILPQGSEEAQSFLQAFLDYIPVGVIHIMEGWDHLAFLAALLILCRRAALALVAVTGFTLGHSVTLALAATDTLIAHVPVIEALIAFTILITAAESSRGRQASAIFLAIAAALAFMAVLSFFVESVANPLFFLGLVIFTLGIYARHARQDATETRARDIPILSSFFGLIHGFGFASVLQEFGLPRDSRLPALLGFNVGVELGQIMLIILFAISVTAILRLRPLRERQTLAREASIAGLGGLGVYWLTIRLFA